MLVACRLGGLSALETYHVDVRVRAQFGPTQGSRRPSAVSAMRVAAKSPEACPAPALWREPGHRAIAGVASLGHEGRAAEGAALRLHPASTPRRSNRAIDRQTAFIAAHDMSREFAAHIVDDRPTASLARRWLMPLVAVKICCAALGAALGQGEAAAAPPIVSVHPIDRIEGRHLSATELALHALRISERILGLHLLFVTRDEPGRRTRGAAGSSERINRPWLVLRRGPR
jgi:hypothetical protein